MVDSGGDPLTALEAALAGRYRLERVLGRGGMGVVYLAHDLKHDREVAIKVLRPEVAALLGRERFLREIGIAAQLSHPHIVPLHDSGEADGQLYYVMPYVSGETLRERMKREGRLPLDAALRIAQQVATALAHAHGRGVVHRDIKPSNILLSQGFALVADFGLARAVSRASEVGDISSIGLPIGTPLYMSPEQALGAPNVDGRSDLFSLGCVLHEMLLGATPGSATVESWRAPQTELTALRPEVPVAVEHTVTRCLARDPAERFATAEEFLASLEILTPGSFGSGEAASGAAPGVEVAVRPSRLPLWIAAGLALLVAGYAVISRMRSGSASSSIGTAPSIAVLAFTNVGGDSTNEPFSDGIADELTTALGKIEGLSVTARTSAFFFKGKGLAAQEVGQRLHVRYIVDGSLRKAQDRLRVGAQLIDVVSGKEVWSDGFEPDTRNRDVFAVQDSIVRSIVEKLRVKLSVGASMLLAKRSTESPEAHSLYQQGRYFFEKRDSASLRKAQDYFERAIRKDSSYALAYAGLSDAYSHSSVFGYAAPHEVFPKAKAAALKALRLDSTSVEAHTAQAFISLFYDWDWPTAGREFDRALTLDPRYPSTHLFHAWYFLAKDRMNDAVREARTAVKLDPFSPVINARLASMLYFAGRYREALDQYGRLFELAPEFFQGRVELGRAYLQLGRCPEALKAIEQPGEQLSSIFRGSKGYIYARCGRRPQALAELNHLDDESKAGHYVSHYALALIHAGLDDTQAALAELENAYEERAWAMFTLKVERAFDRVRSHPRFARLLEKADLVK